MPGVVNGQRRWYQNWWGKLLIGLTVFFSLIVVVVLIMTAIFWWQIQHGQQPVAFLQQTASFTSASALLAQGVGQIDRGRLEAADDPSQGRVGAPVTIVEFVDFKCPNCRAAAPIMSQIVAKYGSTVRWIVRAFPVESTHPGATELSEVAYCADQQHLFWSMHQLLFNEQDTLPVPLTAEALAQLASDARLDLAQLQTCLATKMPEQKVKADYFMGISSGVRGTPTFFVNGQKVEGVVSYADWETYLSKINKP